MSTVVLPMASSPLKRTATDAELDLALAPPTPDPSVLQENHVSKGEEMGILPEKLTAPLTTATGTNCVSPNNPNTAYPAIQAALPSQDHNYPGAKTTPTTSILTSNNTSKRRKLTLAEKEALKIEKAHKELQKKEEAARKEEEKVKKEEEKKAREEEKRAKEELKEAERKKREEEKEEKRKAKEVEKAAKEEEKRKKDAEKAAKEEEKSKKERAQLRLNSFFGNPKPSPSKGPDSPLRGENLIQSRRSSVASVSNGGSKDSSRASSICPEPRKTDWEKCFPSFFLHAHTTLAPQNRLRNVRKSQKVDQSPITGQLDALLGGEQSLTTSSSNALLSIPKRSKSRSNRLSAKEIIARINGTSAHPIDLTKPAPNPSVQMLRALPMKHLKYTEDVRPPYIGTYTRWPSSPRSLSKICRKPCTSRVLPETNYDYDSEAEWEEPGEGEDLDSDGELDDEGDDDADDMEGFLDDEGAESGRKRVFGGDMLPVQTAICWDDGTRGKKEVEFGEGKLDLKSLSIEGLMVDLVFPIDPFSTAYWPSATAVSTAPSSTITGQLSTAASLSPSQPRLPLNAASISTSNLPFPHLAHAPHDSSKLSLATTITSAAATKGTSPATAGKPPKKPFPTELLPDLKKAVEGSDLTKAGLVEILKKRFPKVGKDAIHYTLGQIAERVGKSESEKKWLLK